MPTRSVLDRFDKPVDTCAKNCKSKRVTITRSAGFLVGYLACSESTQIGQLVDPTWRVST
eukprot:1156724-Pelagomonas_calceolata.AAC.12